MAAQIAALEAEVARLKGVIADWFVDYTADLAPFLALAKAAERVMEWAIRNNVPITDMVFGNLHDVLAHPAVQRAVKETP
jgi:hypothetical protein